MKKTCFFVVFFIFLFLNPAFSFEFKNPFKKQTPQETKKMVETVDEWEQEAIDIPIEERDNKNPEKEKTDKKFYYPDLNYIFEKYNYPQGVRAHDISQIKKYLTKTPTIVADKDCHWVAYTRYYYAPDFNQISSEFFIGELNTKKTKTKRILDYNHKSRARKPILSAGTMNVYPNLFNALVLVDWSANSDKLLIKENVGSMHGGIYKTNLYVYFMQDEINSSKTIELKDFLDSIEGYYLNYENLQLAKYHYLVIPLGFSSDNDNIIVSHVYMFENNNQKIFLGSWGYNLETNETILLSKDNPSQEVSANGLILRQVLD